jgi:hypothetical protein
MSDKLDLILEAINGINKRLDNIEGEMNRRFDEVDKRFNAVDERFTEVDKRFEAVDKQFQTINERFDNVDKQLTDIRRMVDRSNVASTSGDESLLRMITEIRDNMVTKEEIRHANERLDAQSFLIARTQERVEMLRMKEAKKQ